MASAAWRLSRPAARMCSAEMKQAQEQVARDFDREVQRARQKARRSFWQSLKSNPDKLRTIVLNILMATMVLGLSVQVSAQATLAKQTEERRKEEEARSARIAARIGSADWLRRAIGHTMGVPTESVTDAQIARLQKELEFVGERAGEVDEMFFEFEAAMYAGVDEDEDAL